MCRIVYFMIFLLCASPAIARAQKPPEIASAIHASAPYGEGTLSKMLMKVYDISLWTDATTWSMESPFALSILYHMHFTREALANRSVKEMQQIDTLSKEQAEEYTAQLTVLFPSVRDGDIITALFIPRKGVTIYYNGEATGTIKDTEFAKRFISIWMSPKTSEPELRQKLLDNRGA